MNKISIVVTHMPINLVTTGMTSRCIERIRHYTFYDYEIILVSNGWDTFKYDVDLRITNNWNLGNPKAWDQGIEVASYDTIILMDNDVFVEDNWDKEMVDMLDDSIGITFPYSVRGNEEQEYRGRRDGFCFAFKKETYKKAGPFLMDQPFKLGYYEDDYFEYRVQHTMKKHLVACPESRVRHLGQATTKILGYNISRNIELNKAWYEAKTNSTYPNLTK